MKLSKGCIYYTSNRLEPKIAEACRAQLKRAFDGEIIWVSLEPLSERPNIILNEEPGYGTMFKQILAALEASTSEVVFFCEHDVLYDASHFNFTPPDKNKFYYDLNWWKIGRDNLAVHWDAVQVSGLACYRELALKYYASRVASFDPENFDRKFEPTVGTEYETWRALVPHIDIRHQTNTTYNKWKLEHFRDKSTAVNFLSTTIDKIPGWSTIQLEDLIQKEG